MCFEAFNSFWKKEDNEPFLKKINYTFVPGKIYGIAGKVGAGKSTLLKAIVEELPYYSGTLKVNGAVAYVEQ